MVLHDLASDYLPRQIFKHPVARTRWLTSMIIATQEEKIRRIAVRSQPGQIVREILS
jgi:hypothetical protein